MRFSTTWLLAMAVLCNKHVHRQQHPLVRLLDYQVTESGYEPSYDDVDQLYVPGPSLFSFCPHNIQNTSSSKVFFSDDVFGLRPYSTTANHNSTQVYPNIQEQSGKTWAAISKNVS